MTGGKFGKSERKENLRGRMGRKIGRFDPVRFLREMAKPSAKHRDNTKEVHEDKLGQAESNPTRWDVASVNYYDATFNPFGTISQIPQEQAQVSLT